MRRCGGGGKVRGEGGETRGRERKEKWRSGGDGKET